MRKRYTIGLVIIPPMCAGVIFACLTSVSAQQTPTISVGNYVVATGTVAVTHPGENTPIPAKVRDTVFFKDFIQTGPASRAKALFIDDSIVTLGESSAVEVAEHVFDPNVDRRSAVVNLLTGKMRVLVGKLFLGVGSKFEVHTDTAVVAARGTYMVVWIEPAEGMAVPAAYFAQGPITGTGVAVLNGSAQISNAVASVTVPAGSFSIAFPGVPPSPPQGFAGVPTITNQIDATGAEDRPAAETPSETLASTGQTQAVEPVDSTVTPTATTPAAAARGTGGTESRDTATVTIPTVPPIINQAPIEVQMEPETTRARVAPQRQVPINLNFPR